MWKVDEEDMKYAKLREIERLVCKVIGKTVEGPVRKGEKGAKETDVGVKREDYYML